MNAATFSTCQILAVLASHPLPSNSVLVDILLFLPSPTNLKSDSNSLQRPPWICLCALHPAAHPLAQSGLLGDISSVEALGSKPSGRKVFHKLLMNIGISSGSMSNVMNVWTRPTNPHVVWLDPCPASNSRSKEAGFPVAIHSGSRETCFEPTHFFSIFCMECLLMYFIFSGYFCSNIPPSSTFYLFHPLNPA